MSHDTNRKRELLLNLLSGKQQAGGDTNTSQMEIAIIGLSGRYPQAETMDQFWDNLCAGKNCISDVPTDRWDWTQFASASSEDQSLVRAGFIKDVDKFDPLFFGISPREADRMDPQERLFLECTWHTIEDAGYTPNWLSENKKRVGVFAGAMNANYSILGSQNWQDNRKGNRVYACNPTFWSIANRVSYTFDFTGPSFAVDSACSSSLTALHLACESIRRGDCDMALAGGVNLILHPAQLDSLSKMNMLSKSGNCHSFGANADGFIDGEGVGSVLLKPLQQAINDNDNIYAVIAGSGLNSGGKTSGYTVPNPNAQAELIERVIHGAGIHPEQISYIEAHGTGTSLGDPIEVRGLTKAFEKYSKTKQYCAIGSVKSNIGHLEAAAGVSALTKVLLQLKHNRLVPSINSDQINPNIRFENTPFYLQDSVTQWPDDKPRYVGISSFGAGGANAHLVLKSHEREMATEEEEKSPYIVMLSAQTNDILKRSANALLSHLKANKTHPLTTLKNVAFTLASGRVGLNNRLAIVAFDLDDLIGKLHNYVDSTAQNTGLFSGEASDIVSPEPAEISSTNLDILNTLAQRWVKGEIEKPSTLFNSVHPKRISLPGYPFARERYWIQTGESVSAQENTTATTIVATEQPDLLYFSSKWSESSIHSCPQNQDQPHSVFFVENSKIIDQLEATLSSNPLLNNSTWLLPGNNSGTLGHNRHTLSSTDKHSFYASMDTLLNEQKDNVQCIFAWGTNSVHNGYRGLRTLLWLTQYLLDKGLDGRARLIIWHSAEGNLQDQHGYAYAGFIKSLHAERPQLSVKHISFIGKNAQALPVATQFTLLTQELNADASERVIKHDQGKRFVEKIALQPSVTENTNRRIIQSGGTYLVTGGAGGLGRIIAKQLAQQGKVNIVLTGRSAIDDEKQHFLEELRQADTEAVYLSCDVTDSYDVINLFEKIRGRFGELNGIIHSAGILNDCLVQNKRWDDFYKVVSTKTQAVMNLDAASEGLPLDFFMTFSSISAMLGNIGQTDYAYANRYMDSFIQWRNNLVDIGERRGRGITINWPIWADGGMHISPAILKAIEEQIGVMPLETQLGIAAFFNILGSQVSQVAPVYGYPDRIIQHLNATGFTDINLQEVKPSGVTAEPKTATVTKSATTTTSVVDKRHLTETLLRDLVDLTSNVLDIPTTKVNSERVFGDFGFDSITLQELAQQLKKRFDITISPALFFSKNTLTKLANHLIEEHTATLHSIYQPLSPEIPDAIERSSASSVQVTQAVTGQPPTLNNNTDIAVIGAAGILPGAKDLDEFWHNLENGIDCISEIPRERWNWEDFYGEAFGTPNKSNSKWGGFIEDVDKFDYAFFDISQREANFIDPQQRLFLQTTWHALENAGYAPTAFAGTNVGVFSGVEFNDYKDLIDQYGHFHAEMPIGNAHNMIPNRVSYFLDLRGPSEAIDTACSSSLIAINRAIRSLQCGESSMAIAGGISLALSPKTMIGTSQLNIYSPDGRCKTLDKDANGYVKGEGVGVVILKPLQQAIADNDNILGVIKSCSVNHGGRSNSITAPNPDAQSELLLHAYRNAQIPAERIAYIEMHGTGTNLGDPVEVEGIKGAFQKLAKEQGSSLNNARCGIGSVKTNIGHLEPAAGIAGVLKMLLALQKNILPANLHFNELNPLIHLDDSPLYVVDKQQPLVSSADQPAVVGVSSFGFGGSNAHVVIEQWHNEEQTADVEPTETLLFPLSAKNKERLHASCQQLVNYLGANPDLSPTRLAYTLQTGRANLNQRLVCVANTRQALIDALHSHLEEKHNRHCFVGNGKDNAALLDDLKATDFHQHLLEKNDIHLLAKWWAKGLDIDWQQRYSNALPKRLPLPGYPFAKTRCWIPASDNTNVVPIKPIVPQASLDQNAPAAPPTDTDKGQSEQNRVNLYILDKVAELSGMAKGDIQPGHNLALDLGLDSIKMMGLINELISISSDEHVRSFNKLGMNTIINKARTFGELVKIFCSVEIKSKHKNTDKAAVAPSASVALLDAQSVFVPAYFLTKSSSLCTSVELRGPIDISVANLAWHTLVQRHPSLQLQFHWPSESPANLDGVHASFVNTIEALALDARDISDQSEQAQNAYIEQFFNDRLNHQWALDQWPLHRFDLISRSTDEHLLIWSNEHIISDGLSNQTALREFLEIYAALQQGETLPDSAIPTQDAYIAVVEHMNQRVTDTSGETTNSSERSYLFNPENAVKDLERCTFTNITRQLTQTQTQGLKQRAAEKRISLNTLLTCLFTQTVSKFDAQAPALLLQIPTSGRIDNSVEIGNAIGCFAQNLTLQINPQKSLAEQAQFIEQSLQQMLINDVDKAQTQALRAVVKSFPLGTNHSLPKHTLEMLLENVKSNLYFPFTGDTGIQQRYAEIRVGAYRAGTSNSPGAIDFLQEIHNDQLHIFVNYDQAFFSAPLMHEFVNEYTARLEAILDESTVATPEIAPTPAQGNTVISQKLIDGVNRVTGKSLNVTDFTRDIDLDIGIDSLMKIRLITNLQSFFENKINKTQLVRCRTLAEMHHILDDTQPAADPIPATAVNHRDNASQGVTTEDGNGVPDHLGLDDLPISRIIQQCLATPEATAVTHFNGESITYRELHENSNRIANLLIDRGVKNGDYVGLVTHRGPKMITSIIAVLKCGAAYVPMDPIFPADRKRYILNHARIKTILSESALTPQLLEIQNSDNTAHRGAVNRIVLLDDADNQTRAELESVHTDVYQASDWQDYPNTLPHVDIALEDDMVVLFTSGSTGNPKGVYLHHLGYANRIMWHQNAFNLLPGEKVAQKTSCSFDVSIWEHLWPIMYGGIVCAVEKETVTNPWEFADWLLREKIAVAHFVPSMFSEFVNAITDEEHQFPNLRWLIFSGEALPTATVQNWIDHFGLDTGLCNLYGPTEASIDVSYHYIRQRPEDNVAIPIGKAVDNTVLFIRGEDGRRLGEGEMGELIIAGKQLAKGYLYEPELTGNAFIPNTYKGVPGDVVYRTGDLAIERDGGVFEYHGRLDTQVKLRGFRVELGEIENVATSHLAVDEAAVMVVDDELTLWYSGSELDDRVLKQHIGEKCPIYMVPQRLLYRSRLPKNANGKLDRKVLLTSLNSAPDNDTPVTVLPLAPAQRWIFSYFDSPYDWWGASRQTLPNNFDRTVFSHALTIVVNRHEALRTRFVKDEERGFAQEILQRVDNVTLEHETLASQGADFTRHVDNAIHTVATSLKPEQLPLFRVIHYTNSAGEQQLAWVAHHLISDMLSGFIVNREIWDIYHSLQRNTFDANALPEAPQVSEYLNTLTDYFNLENQQSAKSFWNRYAKKRRSLIQLPTDHTLGANVESSSDSVVQQIPKKLVHYLETNGRDYYETSLYTLLSAAVYKLVAQVTRRSWIVISHKLNGRSIPQSTKHFFSSVGNFAINVPVGISLQKSDNFTDIVRHISQEMEQLPAGGMGYDWLATELPASIYPDNLLTGIRINYLGDISTGDSNHGVSERVAPENQKRTSIIEFFFYSKNKEMFVEISYSRNFYARETVESLANRYVEQLKTLSGEIVPELLHTN